MAETTNFELRWTPLDSHSTAPCFIVLTGSGSAHISTGVLRLRFEAAQPLPKEHSRLKALAKTLPITTMLSFVPDKGL